MTRQSMNRAGTLVAVSMLTMSVVTYAFNLVAARWLIPAEFGALTALLSIILISNVVALGIQAAIARQIATQPEQAQAIIKTTSRVAIAIALMIGAAVALFSLVFTPLLNLDSHWPVIFCGMMMVPLTIMGAQAGIAQGSDRWGQLSLIYLASGTGRLVGGTLGMLVLPTATGAMIGLALGGWLPVIAGIGLMRSHATAPMESRKPLVAEAFTASIVLFAYFTLSNLDALLARSVFDEHNSGIYAAGLIMTKSALFLPQFVSVVFFPMLARDAGHRSRITAVSMVAVFGFIATAGVALLPKLALILVGGDKYSEIMNKLWIFAGTGTVLAIVYVLVFDALARRFRGVSAILWLTTFAIVGIAMWLDLRTWQLSVVVAITSGIGAFALLVLPLIQKNHSPTPVTNSQA